MHELLIFWTSWESSAFRGQAEEITNPERTTAEEGFQASLQSFVQTRAACNGAGHTAAALQDHRIGDSLGANAGLRSLSHSAGNAERPTWFLCASYNV